MTRHVPRRIIGLRGEDIRTAQQRTMIMMKMLILSTALLIGSAGVASAATPDSAVPLCSKTVTDECMNPSQAPKSMMTKSHHATKMAHHHHAHRVAR
jgi:hypothetical protein